MTERHSVTVCIAVTVHDVEALAAHIVGNSSIYCGTGPARAREFITVPDNGEIDFETCCRLILDRGCDIPGATTEETYIQ